MSAMTSGMKRTATLLFSDMADSTRIKERGADFYARRLERHRELINAAIAPCKGEVLQYVGDGTVIELPDPASAVKAALAIQRACFDEQWEKVPVRLRVGIHRGEVLETGKTDVPFVGLALDVAARIQSLALPGQILMSVAVAERARETLSANPATTWRAHGFYRFKGVEDEALEIFEVGWTEHSPLTRPPDADKAAAASDKTDAAMLGWRPGSGEAIPDARDWILEQKLGEGGFGEVWLAANGAVPEKKVFKFCFHSDRRRSFQVENTMSRYLVAKLGRRHDIVPVDIIHLDKFPYYIASEYVAGGNLVQWARAEGGLGAVPVERRLRILAETARAAAVAHGIGVIHKDIKPTNILVDESGGEPRARLIDFGIGAVADPSLLDDVDITRLGLTGRVFADNISSRTFTRIYAPPEYLTGAPASVRGDIYALGVLLYQMAAGDFEKPLPADWHRTISDELLAEDIAQCVAGNPEDRFASADELARRLSALPERRVALSAARENERRAIRRKRLVNIGLVSGITLLLVTIASVWGIVRATRAEDAARVAEAEAIAQREAAERQRDRALALFSAGQDFVDGALHGVGDAMFLADGFDLKRTRQALLDVLSNYLERIENDAPAVDSAFANRLIKVYALLSMYLQADGEAAAAARAAQKREVLLRKQIERHPDNFEFRLNLAEAINNQLSLPVHASGGLLSPKERSARLQEVIGILEPMLNDVVSARDYFGEQEKARDDKEPQTVLRRFSIGHLWAAAQLNLAIVEPLPAREKAARLQSVLSRVDEFRALIPQGKPEDSLRGIYDGQEFAIRVYRASVLLEVAPEEAHPELDAIESWCAGHPPAESGVRRDVAVQMHTAQYARWLSLGDAQKARRHRDQVMALCRDRNDPVCSSCLAQVTQTGVKYAEQTDAAPGGVVSNLASLRTTARNNPCDTGALMNWAVGLTSELFGQMMNEAIPQNPERISEFRKLLEEWHQASQLLLTMDATFLEGALPAHGWRAFSGQALCGWVLSHMDQALTDGVAEDVILAGRLGMRQLAELLEEDPDAAEHTLMMMDQLGEAIASQLMEREHFHAIPAAYALRTIMDAEENGDTSDDRYMPRILRAMEQIHLPYLNESAKPFIARFLTTPADKLPDKSVWPEVCLALHLRETAFGLGGDPADAFLRWKLLAEAGCVEAMHALGHAYMIGKGTEKQPRQGITWLEKAGAAGSKPAYAALARHLLNGRPLSDDSARARSYLNNALPHPMATMMLAVLDLNTGDEQSRAKARLALESLANPQAWEPETTLPFERLPYLNTPEALLYLGRAYLSGAGGEAKPDAALPILAAAARAGNAEAMMHLNILLTEGIGGPANPQEGLRWLYHAAEFDTVLNGIPASFLYGLACEGRDEAILEWSRHMRRAAKRNFVPAMQKLYQEFLQPNQTRPAQTEGLHWAKQAANAGDPLAMATLAFFYANGFGGVTPRDMKIAGQWVARAREALTASLNSHDPGVKQEAKLLKPLVEPLLNDFKNKNEIGQEFD